jgi:hypothetical protein
MSTFHCHELLLDNELKSLEKVFFWKGSIFNCDFEGKALEEIFENFHKVFFNDSIHQKVYGKFQMKSSQKLPCKAQNKMFQRSNSQDNKILLGHLIPLKLNKFSTKPFGNS